MFCFFVFVFLALLFIDEFQETPNCDECARIAHTRTAQAIVNCTCIPSERMFLLFLFRHRVWLAAGSLLLSDCLAPLFLSFFFALARSLTHSLSFTPPHLSLWRANFSLSVQKTVLLDCPHKRSSTRRGGGGGGKNKVKMAHLFTA